MIRLEGIGKAYSTTHGRVQVLSDVNLRLDRGQRLGVLGRNGAGKSTLIRLISGVELPTSGHISRDMSISWPLAFGGTFLGMLTGYDNYRFVCRLYGVDPAEKVGFVEDFCELGRYFREPLRTYSAGMRARLAFAVSMAVEFDCFLVDEIVAVGDARFQAKCDRELFEKRGDRAFLIVSHHPDFIRQHCNAAAVLMDGCLHHFDTIDEAYDVYNQHLVRDPARTSMRPAPSPAAGVPYPAGGGGNEADAGVAAMSVKVDTLTELLVTADSENSEVSLPLVVRAFAQEPLEQGVFLGVIDRLRSDGRQATLQRFVEASAEIFPSVALHHVVLGDLYGTSAKALKAYRSAIAADPSSFWAHRNLAIGFFNLGCYRDALPHFSAALGLAPTGELRTDLQAHYLDAQNYLGCIDPAALGSLEMSPHRFREGTATYFPKLGLLEVSVAGIAGPKGQGDALRCRVTVDGDQRSEFALEPGRNSITRLAAVAGLDAFSIVATLRQAHAPSAVDITLVDGAEIKASFRISPVLQDESGLPDDCDEMSPAAAAAICARRHLDRQAELLFTLAVQEGEPMEHELFAELLINHGYYHRALKHLRDCFSGVRPAAMLEPGGGRLFDLLCVEVARARMPGWREEIASLAAARTNLRAGDANALMNEGHLRVDSGDLDAAIRLYDAAATAADGQEMIHFARGIFTARFAAKQLDVLEPVTGVAPLPVDRICHLFACDKRYFARYGRAAIRSSRETSGSQNVITHVHIVDPDAETFDLVRKLQQEFLFNVTTEYVPFDNVPDHFRIAYYTSARFIAAAGMLKVYNCPVLVTETDCLIRWSWDEIREWCEGADFGSVQSSLWNLVPWTRIPAGIVYFNHGELGQSMAGLLKRILTGLFEDASHYSDNIWTIDQVALWLALEIFGTSLQARHLPMYDILNLATGDKTGILN